MWYRKRTDFGAPQTWVEISPKRELDDLGLEKDSMVMYVKCLTWNLTIIASHMVAVIFILIQRQDVMLKGPFDFLLLTRPGKFNF